MRPPAAVGGRTGASRCVTAQDHKRRCVSGVNTMFAERLACSRAFVRSWRCASVRTSWCCLSNDITPIAPPTATPLPAHVRVRALGRLPLFVGGRRGTRWARGNEGQCVRVREGRPARAALACCLACSSSALPRSTVLRIIVTCDDTSDGRRDSKQNACQRLSAHARSIPGVASMSEGASAAAGAAAAAARFETRCCCLHLLLRLLQLRADVLVVLVGVALGLQLRLKFLLLLFAARQLPLRRR